MRMIHHWGSRLLVYAVQYGCGGCINCTETVGGDGAKLAEKNRLSLWVGSLVRVVQHQCKVYAMAMKKTAMANSRANTSFPHRSYAVKDMCLGIILD